MGENILEVAKALKDVDTKVQLIYAFNGTGKTRLSREFKQLVAPREAEDTEEAVADRGGSPRNRFLYYSAFTEDLFYWDNDLEGNSEPKLRIQPNTFTDWVLKDQGQDINAITTFQRYTNDKLTPHFKEDFSEVTFSIERGDDDNSGNLKISKGEESNFIWSIFYTLLEQAIATLNDVELDFPEPTPFDELEYVFIDDPVSSLDDNHLIRLAVDLSQLVKSSNSTVRFVITTHNPLFFNVLCNEFRRDEKTERYSWKSKGFRQFHFEKTLDGSLNLVPQPSDSPFAYHLHLISLLKAAIESGQIEKYHFNLLRNLLEKTATFLGYKNWDKLLPSSGDGASSQYAARIVNFSSHSKHSAEEVQPLKPEEKMLLDMLLKHVIEKHNFWQEEDA